MRRRIREVRKRDNRVVPFDETKIADAIYRAIRSAGEGDRQLAEELASAVVHFLEERFEGEIPGIEDIQDLVETVLMEMGHPRIAKAYILYRQKRAMLRETLEVRKVKPHGEGVSFDYADDVVRKPPGGEPSGVPSPLPEVEEALVGTSSWSKSKITAALIREADLAPEVADEVASSVERKVLASGIRRISTSLIRELVDNELFERGYNTTLEKQTPIGLPQYNLEQIIFGTDSKEGYAYPKDPSEIREIIANRILHQYSLRRVFSQPVADAHREGRLFLHRLSDPVRVARLRWDAAASFAALGAGAGPLRGRGGGVGFLNLLSELALHVSEEIRIAGLESAEVRAATGRSGGALAAEVLGRLAQMGPRPDLALEFSATRAAVPWLEELLELSRTRARRFIVALRLPPEGPGSEVWDEMLEAVLPLAGELFRRGEIFEVLPPEGRGRNPGAPPQSILLTVAKVTINLPRCAYRSGRDRRSSIEGELDAIADICLRAHLERKRFVASLAANPEGPLWGLLGKARGERPLAELERESTFALGLLGLNECVRFLCGAGPAAHADAARLARSLVRRLASKARSEGDRLGLNITVEETANVGPLRVLEDADRRLYPEHVEGRAGRVRYTDGVRLDGAAPVDPLTRVQYLAGFLDWLSPHGGILDDSPELRHVPDDVLASLLEEGWPAVRRGGTDRYMQAGVRS